MSTALVANPHKNFAYSISPMDYKEMEQIYESLKMYSSIFSKLWWVSKPIFVPEHHQIPTAGIVFDEVGNEINFMINIGFWRQLNRQQKKFIVCHEILHIMFLHGYRAMGMAKSTALDQGMANVAMDLVVNQYLEKVLRFNRAVVDPKEEVIWMETVWPNVEERRKIAANRNFEYYFAAIQKAVEERKQNIPDMSKEDILAGMGNTIDDHSQMDMLNGMAFSKKLMETFEPHELKDFFGGHNARQSMGGDPQQILEKLQQDAAQANSGKGGGKGGQEAGDQQGANWIKIVMDRPPPKRKWESVIKNWAMKKMDFEDKEQWVRPGRNHALLPKDFALPSVNESDQLKKDKIEVWFFLDTSGSCTELAPRFLKAAYSLDPKRFDVRMHCFDTHVYPMKKNSTELFGFGGTQFSIIETYIQNTIKKEEKQYKDLTVWILSDGYGDEVTPEIPSKYYIFNSTQYFDCFKGVPKSQMFDLKDYE